MQSRSRTFILLFLIVLIVVAIFLDRTGRLKGFLQPKPAMVLPVDLHKIIPASWTVLKDQEQQCDYDGDGEEEWLVLYRYDRTSVQLPLGKSGDTVSRGPIGGVIYDAQVNRIPQETGNQSPYRPAFLIPYKLLPDFYTGKGQGYLGETKVVLVPHKPDPKSTTCQTDEVTLFGYSDSQLPTRLSIFRWKGKEIGYEGAHFVGNARIEVSPAPDDTHQITQTRTFNRLDNHRSLLCEQREFDRQTTSNLVFQENADSYTIDFCFGAPNDPIYPEGVVIALLRGASLEDNDRSPSPTGTSFLTADAALPPGLASLKNEKRSSFRVLAVSNEGTVAPHPGDGEKCPPGKLSKPGNDTWWCGRERAEVTTEIILDNQPRQVIWHLISIASEKVSADVHWRIEKGELR